MAIKNNREAFSRHRESTHDERVAKRQRMMKEREPTPLEMHFNLMAQNDVNIDPEVQEMLQRRRQGLPVVESNHRHPGPYQVFSE